MHLGLGQDLALGKLSNPMWSVIPNTIRASTHLLYARRNVFCHRRRFTYTTDPCISSTLLALVKKTLVKPLLLLPTVLLKPADNGVGSIYITTLYLYRLLTLFSFFLAKKSWSCAVHIVGGQASQLNYKKGVRADNLLVV